MNIYILQKHDEFIDLIGSGTAFFVEKRSKRQLYIALQLGFQQIKYERNKIYF